MLRLARASKGKKKKEKAAFAPTRSAVQARPAKPVKPAVTAARKARKPAPVHDDTPVEAPRQLLPERAAAIESALRLWRLAEAKKKGCACLPDP